MALTKDEKWSRVYDDCMAGFRAAQDAVYDDRMQCLADRRFANIPGAQWEGALAEQYKNRPMIEVNKCSMAVVKVQNEYRNNRIDANFIPRDGSENDAMSETCNGLYRADEHDSVAQEAYDTAFDEAVTGGFGAWRLRAVYEDELDEENDLQRIAFEPISDADSRVFFDVGAKRQDKSDATSAWVRNPMSPDAYKAEWNDDPASWPKEIQMLQFDWYVPDRVVYVAEYYVIEIKKTVIHIFRGLDGKEVRHTDEELDDDEGALRDQLQATGYIESRQKKIKTKRVHKYIVSGGGVLEDCGIIPGDSIPVVPVYGQRMIIDNVERCKGKIREAKDSQRLKNMQLTKLAEISALSSVEKPILTPEQIAGHGVMWSRDNIDQYPYLLINAVTDAMGNPTAVGPAAYTRSPQIPPAMAALLQITEKDMQDILGNPESMNQIMPNQSGVSIELQQSRIDMQAYIYISNFAKAIKRSAEIWYGMARELLVEEGRKMKTINDQGEAGQIEIMRPVVNEETGVIEYENDISNSKMEVFIEVGPSSSSKRQATVRSLTQMMGMTQDQETQTILSALAMYNLEGEGMGDVRKWFRRKLVTMGVVPPSKEEQQEMQASAQNQQPNPNDVFLKASAEKAQADAMKSQTAAQLDVAKTEQVKAETAKTIAQTQMDLQDHYVDALEQVGSVAATGQPQPMAEQQGDEYAD